MDATHHFVVYGIFTTHPRHNWALSVTLVAVKVQKSKPCPFWPDFLDPGDPIFQEHGQGAANPQEPTRCTLLTFNKVKSIV